MTGFSIPDDYPLQKIVGQEITQVCIGKHSVGLNFYQASRNENTSDQWEPGATIEIESGFVLRTERLTETIVASNETLGVSAGCLTILLGSSVVAVTRLPKNELLLRFSNGSELQLVTDPTGFESYHLYIEGDCVDVTAQG